MTATDDFAPMVEQGELEAASGLVGRRRRRHDLAPVDAGFVRVLVGDDGSLVAAHGLTGGEKRWGRARSWVKVDVAQHALDYAVAFADPTGRAGFEALVTVRAAVEDPLEVVRKRITSVRDFLLPAVRRVVLRASEAIEPTSARDPIVALTTMRQRADVCLRLAVDGPVVEAPKWLAAEFVSVTVEFDQDTQAHHTGLVGRERDGELIDFDQVNEEKRTTASLAVRALWREELLPHLSNPAQRVFEVAFADPTQQNLARAVEQVTSAELQLLSQGFEMLRTMVDKDFVDKDDPFYAAIEAMSGKLTHLYLPGAAGALRGAPQSGLGLGDDADEVIDHEPPNIEEEPGDHAWGDH